MMMGVGACEKAEDLLHCCRYSGRTCGFAGTVSCRRTHYHLTCSLIYWITRSSSRKRRLLIEIIDFILGELQILKISLATKICWTHGHLWTTATRHCMPKYLSMSLKATIYKKSMWNLLEQENSVIHPYRSPS